MKYTLSRLVLFAVCVGVLYLAGARSILLFALALLISGVLSWWLLAGQREAFARSVQERAERSSRKAAERAAAEDAADDAARAAQEAQPNQEAQGAQPNQDAQPGDAPESPQTPA